jgi:hypothetical protein
MQTSDALDLEPNIFKSQDPQAIARSLKHSAEVSTRRKADPFRSAMSMLTFYINRGGKNLDKKQKAILEQAKDELRIAFGREPRATESRNSRSRPQQASPARKTPKTRASRRASSRKSRS